MGDTDTQASYNRLPVVGAVQRHPPSPTNPPAGQETCASHGTLTKGPPGRLLGPGRRDPGQGVFLFPPACSPSHSRTSSVNRKVIIMTTAHQLLKHVPLNTL